MLDVGDDVAEFGELAAVAMLMPRLVMGMADAGMNSGADADGADFTEGENTGAAGENGAADADGVDFFAGEKGGANAEMFLIAGEERLGGDTIVIAGECERAGGDKMLIPAPGAGAAGGERGDGMDDVDAAEVGAGACSITFLFFFHRYDSFCGR